MFYTLHEISYSVSIVKLVAFYAFYQQNCDELGVKVRFVSLNGQVLWGPSLTAQMAEWYGASVSEAVDLGLIPSRVKPMTSKLIFTASLIDAQH